VNVDSAPLFLLQQNTYFNAVCFEWLKFVAFADSEFFFSLDMDVTSGLYILSHTQSMDIAEESSEKSIQKRATV